MFNGKPERLESQKVNTFVLNAERGLLVGTSASVNQQIQMTVNGAIRIGTGGAFTGAIITKTRS